MPIFAWVTLTFVVGGLFPITLMVGQVMMTTDIDRVLGKHYGFTDEEVDFIINYDIKYRMGSDLFDDEGEE